MEEEGFVICSGL